MINVIDSDFVPRTDASMITAFVFAADVTYDIYNGQGFGARDCCR